VVGRLTCNPAGFGFVVPDQRREGESDVYVSADNLKDAMHGDRVIARVERTSARGPEGAVVRVLERGLQRLVGRYESDGRFGGHVVPFDRRVLHEVRIPAGDELGAEAGQMVGVEITKAPTANRGPAGRVTKVLGRIDEPGVDVKVVMEKFSLPEAFPQEVEDAAHAVPSSVRDEDRVGRTDFRPWLTVTVDPATAKDHDDAISLDYMGNGNYLLGVHIADVAHYVVEGGLLDQEAYLRGTSVYFPGSVVPMLPHALSSNICSLVEGLDRLSQTVVLEIDRQSGRVVRTEFHDGVIRSAAKLSYQQMQGVVDGDEALRTELAAVAPLLLRMDELRKVLRKVRADRGSIDFDVPAPKLQYDLEGAMTGVIAEERLDSMRAIEEFMLLANEAVAGALSAAGVGALYRVHEQPDPKKVEEFCELVASLGYSLPQGLEEMRPEDFQRVLRQAEGKPESKFVSYLLLRTMRLARYHGENLGHFGLATERYAHFTSPIRRYPDLVVHRALRGMRHGQPLVHLTPEALDEMGRHLSERERQADEAEREIIEWKKVRFMADKVSETFHAYVTGVQAYGLFVELEEVYVQGLVHVSSMSDDYYELDEKAHRLSGQSSGRSFRLGDRIEVRVARVDLERRQVDLVLEDVAARAHAAPGGSERRQGSRGAERGSTSGRGTGRVGTDRAEGKPKRGDAKRAPVKRDGAPKRGGRGGGGSRASGPAAPGKRKRR
ncbi:MAG: ribonuclease R, partial [Vicinamibacteria bacterium]|nr:ribonuclease R [Vicinamibacteria bacterium]